MQKRDMDVFRFMADLVFRHCSPCVKTPTDPQRHKGSECLQTLQPGDWSSASDLSVQPQT